jgi:colanic acid/amylovoran/stewartan biosynthesis glycosyltransferase WcaL/AmsK/CpsK
VNIAFFVNEFPSLSETFILNQITGLLAHGHDIDIYAARPGKSSVVHEDVHKHNLLKKTHYYPSLEIPTNPLQRATGAAHMLLRNPPHHRTSLLRVLNFIKFRRTALSLRSLYKVHVWLDRVKKKYDIVHCHFGPNGNLAVLLKEAGLLKGKVVTTFHGYDLSSVVQQSGTGVYRSLFRLGDLFLPISETWRQKLIDMGCAPNRVLVHRMGVDTAKYRYRLRESRPGELQLLTVARLVEKKGIEFAIRAVAKVRLKYPRVRYKIAGDGPLRPKLADLISELDLRDCVTLIGARTQEEIVALARDAHVFVAPSVTGKNGDQEGIPVGLMEALAQGMPVISTLHGGIPELIQHGQSGFLVPERDVEELAATLELLLSNPQLWAGMGKAGRSFVEEHYNIAKLNDRLLNIYERLRATRSGSPSRI